VHDVADRLSRQVELEHSRVWREQQRVA
jgi:hypothetical protein